MKTGLFFGSFNPIHTGHLIIANHFAQELDLDQVWFVVSPQNPLKNIVDLLDEDHRLSMVKLAIENNRYFDSSDIEFRLSKPSYTIDTLNQLKSEYPERTWVLIMGADSIETLPQWRNYEQLVQDYEILVYPRPFYHVEQSAMPEQIRFANDVPLIEISATYIRTAIKSGKNCRYLLPEKVYEYIIKHKLYS